MQQQQQQRVKVTQVEIPEGVNVLGLGSFMLCKGIEGISQDLALEIDNLVSKLSVSALKFVGQQLNSSDKLAYDVASYNMTHQYSNKVTDDAKSKACGYGQYSNYVNGMSLTSVKLITAASMAMSSVGKSELEFTFENGSLQLNVDGKDYPIQEAKDNIEMLLKSKSQNVRVDHTTLIQNYAKDQFLTHDVRDGFMKSEKKTVNGVSLIELASSLKNGFPTGVYGKVTAAKEMSSTFVTYLGLENKTFRAYHTGENGSVNNGTEIPGASAFFKHGLDVDGVGVSSVIAANIAKEVGANINVTSLDAKNHFLSLLGEEDTPILRSFAFDYAWMAEEFSAAKTSDILKKEFKKKYKRILIMSPCYLGKGPFTYALTPGNLAEPIQPEIFMAIPNIVEKLVAYYALICNLLKRPTLSSFIELLFRRYRHPTIEKLVKSALMKSFGTYRFKVPFVGVRKEVTLGWTEEVKFKDDKGEVAPLSEELFEWEMPVVVSVGNYNREREIKGDQSNHVNLKRSLFDDIEARRVPENEPLSDETLKKVKKAGSRLGMKPESFEELSAGKRDRYLKKMLILHGSEILTEEQAEEFLEPTFDRISLMGKEDFLNGLNSYAIYLQEFGFKVNFGNEVQEILLAYLPKSTFKWE